MTNDDIQLATLFDSLKTGQIVTVNFTSCMGRTNGDVQQQPPRVDGSRRHGRPAAQHQGQLTRTQETVTVHTQLQLNDRVIGLFGEGIIIEFTTMFREPFAWVRFDGCDDAKPCPLRGLNPEANWHEVQAPKRFDTTQQRWVSID